MIKPSKIEKALADIDRKKQLVYADKLEKIAADVEEKIKDPMLLPEQLKKLDTFYLSAPEEKREMYAEIKNMIVTTLAEYSTILKNDFNEVLEKMREALREN